MFVPEAQRVLPHAGSPGPLDHARRSSIASFARARAPTPQTSTLDPVFLAHPHGRSEKDHPLGQCQGNSTLLSALPYACQSGAFAAFHPGLSQRGVDERSRSCHPTSCALNRKF